MKINGAVSNVKFNSILKPIRYNKNSRQADKISSKPFGIANLHQALIKFNLFKENDFAREFFLNDGKVRRDTCEDVIKNHVHTLSKAYNIVEKSYMCETPVISAKAGYFLKQYFDNKYDNYRIISIGTSPAIIAQALEYLGAEVVYLPVTGAKKFHYEPPSLSFLKKRDIADLRNVRLLIDYFKSKVKKDTSKTNILLDFTLSGTTLNLIGQLLSQNTDIDNDKFVKCSLVDTLKEIKNNPTGEANISLMNGEIKDIFDDCLSQSIEDAGNVPHFFIDENENGDTRYDNYISSRGKTFKRVFLEFERYSTEYGNAYSLCMYNEMKKMGLV